MAYAQAIVRLIQEFAKLPGVGEKTAERLAFHLLAQSTSDALLLADAIRALKEQVKSCTTCYNVTERDPCEICADASRETSAICVVEQMRDLWAIERTGSYRGLYHVLHGRLSPLDGVGPENLTIPGLVDRVRRGGVKEVILATNPTTEGDATAYYIQRALDAGVVVTRIARGIPAGSTLEYSDRTVVGDALSGRRELQP
ncbi:MAG TPA: recombination mediator RecR [Planctomycetota bacterium]|nr:recombination mediator RecR [Planctomycetota bacterium]